MRLSPCAARSLFVISFALPLGCATPAPIVRLNPKTANIVWVGGRASVQAEQGGVHVATAFEHQAGRTFGLRVEIENGTDARIEVGPEDVTYTSCVDETTASCTPTRRIIDPEQMLAALDMEQSRGAAEAANSQALLGTLVLLSAVGDVASVAGGHAHASTGLRTVAAADLMGSDAAARNGEQETIAFRRQIWSDQALRRNTLDPGRGIAGLVYLPIDLRAGYVWLHVRVAGALFQFRFEEVVTPIGMPSTGSQARRF
jgi:hypothetical protein